MDFEEIRRQASSLRGATLAGAKPRILIGTGTCGTAAGAEDILMALGQALEKNGLEAEIVQVGCIGLCYAEPLVDIVKPGRPRICYGNVTPGLMSEIVRTIWSETIPAPTWPWAHGAKVPSTAFPAFLTCRCSSPRCASPCGTAGTSTRPISTITCPRRLQRAGQRSEDEPGGGHRRGQEVRPAGPGRRRFPHRPQVGVLPRGARRRRSTSSATPTKATPALS